MEENGKELEENGREWRITEQKRRTEQNLTLRIYVFSPFPVSCASYDAWGRSLAPLPLVAITMNMSSVRLCALLILIALMYGTT